MKDITDSEGEVEMRPVNISDCFHQTLENVTIYFN